VCDKVVCNKKSALKSSRGECPWLLGLELRSCLQELKHLNDLHRDCPEMKERRITTALVRLDKQEIGAGGGLAK